MRALVRISQPSFFLSLLVILALSVGAARAADRDRLEAFLEITGFDVALESIRLGADNAPAMLGITADAFGSEWKRLVGEVFATDVMLDMGLDILEQTLDDDMLAHAAEFYASDLGRRLVAAENKSHMVEDDDLKRTTGEEIIAGLVRIGSPRVALLNRMNDAIGSDDVTIRSVREVQVRFLMAAAAAGVIEMRMDESDLRGALSLEDPELRRRLKASALASAAYTYQAFSDEEIAAYADALEHPRMQKVYELLNAVQFEITANRYEEVASRLSGMQPSQDL